MARTPREYSKLARGTASIAVRGSLWRGKDHVLYVTSSGYTETYRRFYFADIQAFIIRKTQRFFFENLILLIFALLCGMGAMISFTPGQGNVAMMVGLIFMGTFLLSILINAAVGPTCRFHVQTAVGQEELAPVRRIRRAKKIVTALRPFMDVWQAGETVEPQSPQSEVTTTAAAVEQSQPQSTGG